MAIAVAADVSFARITQSVCSVMMALGILLSASVASAEEAVSVVGNVPKIAFLRLTNGYWQYWLMNADGSNPRQLTDTPIDKVNANWGPTNRALMYNTNRGETFVLDLEAKNHQQILKSEMIYDAAWSPDGKQIAFGISPSDLVKGKSSLWVANYDGSNKKQVAGSAVSDAHYAAWYNNGKELVFRQCVMASNMEVHHDFWISEVSGAQLRPISGDYEMLKFDQTVSADGTVAYSSVRSGFYEIWAIPVTGGNAKQLTSFKTYAGNPSVSADNRLVALDADGSEGRQIYVVGIDGSSLKQLTHERVPSRNPVWTH